MTTEHSTADVIAEPNRSPLRAAHARVSPTVPCPPGTADVRSGRRRSCITVVPVTASFSAARALCGQLGGALARPFGRSGRRDRKLREAIGPVNGWLGARGGGGSPRWPHRFHPRQLWYDNNLVPPSSGEYWVVGTALGQLVQDAALEQ